MPLAALWMLAAELWPIRPATFAALALSIGFVLTAVYQLYQHYKNYINVPTVGARPGLLGRLDPRNRARWMSADSYALMCEGVAKYGPEGKPFKIGSSQRWNVFFTSPKMLDELKNLPVSLMNSRGAIDDMFCSPYGFYKDIFHEALHLNFVRKNLTTDLWDVTEEITLSWNDMLANVGDDWKEVAVIDSAREVISRSSGRKFVGLPLCRNREYLDTQVNFVTGFLVHALGIDNWPPFLRPIVARLIMKHNHASNTMLRLVGPFFDRRREEIRRARFENKELNVPDDAITAFLEATPYNTPNRTLAIRLMALGFVSIHTTSTAITHAIYDLATYPEYQKILREEAEVVLAQEGGWTKAAVLKLTKIDSFAKESARVNGAVPISFMRRAQQNHTFSDGTFVPAGNWVLAPLPALHHSPQYLSDGTDPLVFDGLRYWRRRQQPGQGARHQLAQAWNGDPDDMFMLWGGGELACPGRFFAANEIKITLAHLLMGWDISLPEGVTKRPESTYMGNQGAIPDPNAGIRFRRRGAV